MISLLLDIFSFLSVVLRGLVLTTQAFTLGGIGFLALLGVPLAPSFGVQGDSIIEKSARFLRVSALGLAVVTALALGLNSTVLVGTVQLDWGDALDANFAHANMLVIAAALLIAVLSRPALIKKYCLVLVAIGLVLLAAQVSSTHAVSRVGMRWHLIVSDFFHMLGASIWIGGLPYFLIALNAIRDVSGWRLAGRRYSLMSMTSVGLIVAGGVVMAVTYIGSIESVYGTAYGVMTMTKVLLLLGLLFLGAMNYRTVEALRRDPATPVLRLKRFAEVEIGIGLTVLFAAASLTSLPPGEDLKHDRANLHEIADRLLPKWPIRLASPDHDALAISQLDDRIAASKTSNTAVPLAFVPGEGLAPPRNAADIAWSEYNHHWAGIFVLLMGCLALLENLRLARWARHWPAIFFVMAAFLFVRSDPEVWPLGQIGFFESLRDPEVVQHRLFVVLIILFGLFEWLVRLGKIAHPKAALLFPLITALGGMMLLTHSHALANIKDQLLIEMSHVPLALAAITAGWARWLELRLDGRISVVAARIWPAAFVLMGVILLVYREA